MDNPERHLKEWIRSYFFDGKDDDDSREKAQMAADACVERMRQRGWQFEPAPIS